jgi:hypothetical protein
MDNKKADFKKCLEVGHYYEKKSIKILLKHNFIKIRNNYKYNPYYDLKAFKDRKRVYIEVKYNKLTHITNKIFLEVCKRNLEPSGITITKAQYYIFFSMYKYYICLVNDVKKLLEQTIRNILINNNIENPTREQIILYIEHEAIKTNNTIGILINVVDVIKICHYTGTHKKKNIYNKNLFKN